MKTIATILFCLISSALYSQEKKSTQAQIAEQLAEMREVVESELLRAGKMTSLDRVAMRLDALASHFELEEAELAKIKQSAEGYASKQLEECKPHIVRFLQEVIGPARQADLIDVKVMVNGKAVYNKESLSETQFVVDVPKRWIQWEGRMGASGSWLEMRETIDFSEGDFWSEVFQGILSKQQLSEYQNDFLASEKAALARGSVCFSEQLRLSQEQSDRLGVELSEIMAQSNQSTIYEFGRWLSKSYLLDQVDLEPLGLSEAQNAVIKFSAIPYRAKAVGKPTQLDDGEKLKDALDSAVREAVTESIVSEYQLEFDEFARFVGMEERESKKLRVLVKGVAGGLARKILNNSESELEKLKAAVDDVTQAIVVNQIGFRRTLRGGESRNDDELIVTLKKPVDNMFMASAAQSGERSGGASCRFMLPDRESWGLAKEPRWQKALESMDGEYREKYEATRLERSKKAVIGGVISALAVDLVLTKSQKEELQRYLESDPSSLSLQSEKVRANAVATLKKLPSLDFLSESQNRYLKVIQARASN